MIIPVEGLNVAKSILHFSFILFCLGGGSLATELALKEHIKFKYCTTAAAQRHCFFLFLQDSLVHMHRPTPSLHLLLVTFFTEELENEGYCCTGARFQFSKLHAHRKRTPLRKNGKNPRDQAAIHGVLSRISFQQLHLHSNF